MNCVILEDEYPAREELKYFVKTFSNINILAEFEDPLEGLKYMDNNKVDIMFVDINMPNLDGMSLAKIVNNFKDKPKIVFITAYKEYAVDAFEIEAFDYILKPYSEERIIYTLKKLEKENTNQSDKILNKKITLWKHEKMVVLDVDDIYYCMAKERDTLVYTKDDSYVVNMSISDFFEKLPQENYFKSHRSYILNINKIKEIIPWFNNTYNIILKDIDVEIPVSRKNVKEFKQMMGI